MNRTILAVALVALCSPAMAQVPGFPLRSKQKPKATAEKPAFDAKAATKKYIEDSTNDPAKLSFVSVDDPVSTGRVRIFEKELATYKADRQSDLLWAPLDEGGWVVCTKYRAANALGAVVVAETAVIFAGDGTIISAIPKSDIKIWPTKAARDASIKKQDSSLDELDDLRRAVNGR